MMYAKLVFRNARRSVKDYLIYIVTMTICATLFYAFLSISSRYYRPDIGTEYDFTLLSDGMKAAICAVTLLLLFLIRYVNNYMLRRRQKEFAVEFVMGMEQRAVGLLFFAETLAMGAVSVVLGILGGAVCSQFITAMLFSTYGKRYRLAWTLFPDTVLLTVCFFAAILVIVGILNIRAISKIKIIDMLNAERRNEPHLSKSRFMPAVTLLYLAALIGALITGVRIMHYYFDSRLPLPVHLLFWGNIAAPAMALLWPAVWMFGRKKLGPGGLIAGEAVLAVLNAAFAAAVPVMRGEYLLSYGAGVLNQYLLFLAVHVIYIICGSMFLTNSAIIAWKERSPEHRYQGQTLFFLGQILSKLATNTKTMALICMTLVLSVFLFIAAPVLTEWSLGYLDIRSMYDVQISSRYNQVREEEGLPEDDYEAVGAFLSEKGIESKYDRTFSLYLPNRADFHSRVKWGFPVAAISLSDYNYLREMLGYERIMLKENEFTTQWQTIAADEDREAFIRSHGEISTDAGILTLAGESWHEEPIGETVYNSYTDVLYVFPDSVCDRLLGVMRNRYIITEAPLSFDDAQALERIFTRLYPEETGDGGGAQYAVRTRTLQVNGALASNFILKTSMIYGAVVLMVICLTVLALQQLLDAAQYRSRFSVLRSLGVEEREIGRLILKQLGVWFGLPVSFAVLLSGIVSGYFLQTVSAQINAYIGTDVLLAQVGVTAAVLGLLLVCYFITTWILFKRSVS